MDGEVKCWFFVNQWKNLTRDNNVYGQIYSLIIFFKARRFYTDNQVVKSYAATP